MSNNSVVMCARIRLDHITKRLYNIIFRLYLYGQYSAKQIVPRRVLRIENSRLRYLSIISVCIKYLYYTGEIILLKYIMMIIFNCLLKQLYIGIGTADVLD